MATFIDFLASGKLGPLELGDSEEKVRSALGEPRTTLDPRIWEYGALALKFENTENGNKVSLMQLNFADPSKALPHKLGLTDWVPSPDLSIQQFKGSLNSSGLREGMDFTLSSFKGGSERLDMASGVEATFIEGKLIWIVASALHRPKGKQIAVFVPDDVVQFLGKEAAQRKISMAALCSEWISEHARSVLHH